MRTPTEKLIIISIACFLSAFVSQPVLAQKSKTIYHKDWIDLNKKREERHLRNSDSSYRSSHCRFAFADDR